MKAVNKRVFLFTVVTDLRVSILVCELMGKLEVIVPENRPLQIREPSRKKITLTPFFCNLINCIILVESEFSPYRNSRTKKG